jgi:hypothetical protein
MDEGIEEVVAVRKCGWGGVYKCNCGGGDSGRFALHSGWNRGGGGIEFILNAKIEWVRVPGG